MHTYFKTYPLPILAVLLSLLSAMMWVFITKVRLGTTWTDLIAVHAPSRETVEFLQAKIPSLGASSMEVFMQTEPETTVISPVFLTALDKYSTAIESISHVVGVRNLIRIQPGLTVGQYVSYYSNSSSELSLQVQSPFYISDLRSISRTTIVLDLDSSDSRTPEIIRKIRRLDAGEISAALTIYGLGG